MLDPFRLLGADAGVTPAGLAAAYARAVKAGLPAAQARKAMEMLRHPEAREAAGLLAISQAPAFQRMAAAAAVAPAEEALDVLLEVLGVILADLRVYLASAEALPAITVDRDVRDYYPPPMEALEP